MKKKKYLLPLFISTLFVACAPETDTQPTPSDVRDDIIGSWTCAETSKINGSSTFTVHFTKSTTVDNEMIVENFYNYGFNKTITVKVTKTSITIPSQTFSSTNKISGSGTLTTTKMNINYVVDDGSGTSAAIDSCSGVFTKQ